MSEPNSPLLPHGDYEHLRSYKVAEAVYDATVVFCDRFIDKGNKVKNGYGFTVRVRHRIRYGTVLGE